MLLTSDHGPCRSVAESSKTKSGQVVQRCCWRAVAAQGQEPLDVSAASALPPRREAANINRRVFHLEQTPPPCSITRWSTATRAANCSSNIPHPCSVTKRHAPFIPATKIPINGQGRMTRLQFAWSHRVSGKGGGGLCGMASCRATSLQVLLWLLFYGKQVVNF